MLVVASASLAAAVIYTSVPLAAFSSMANVSSLTVGFSFKSLTLIVIVAVSVKPGVPPSSGYLAEVLGNFEDGVDRLRPTRRSTVRFRPRFQSSTESPRSCRTGSRILPCPSLRHS